MKNKKMLLKMMLVLPLLTSILSTSLNTPIDTVASASSNSSVSTNNQSVSKDTAYKYTYKVLKEINIINGLTEGTVKLLSRATVKKTYTVTNFVTSSNSYITFHISKNKSSIKVHTYAKTKKSANSSNFKSAGKDFYTHYGIKRTYTFHE